MCVNISTCCSRSTVTAMKTLDNELKLLATTKKFPEDDVVSIIMFKKNPIILLINLDTEEGFMHIRADRML